MGRQNDGSVSGKSLQKILVVNRTKETGTLELGVNRNHSWMIRVDALYDAGKYGAGNCWGMRIKCSKARCVQGDDDDVMSRKLRTSDWNRVLTVLSSMLFSELVA